MPTFDNEMGEILQSFLVESHELIEALGQDLVALEKDPTQSELHHRIFRAVHTLKGTSSFLGLEQITELAHHFEDVMNRIRKGELMVVASTMDAMFEAYDLLRELLKRVEARHADPIDLTGIIARLDAIARNQNDTPGEALRQPVVGEKKAESDPPLARREDPAARGREPRAVDTTIRVDVKRLDHLMNLVGELVLNRNRITQIAQNISQQYEGSALSRELADTSGRLDLITTELQMAVMKARMMPVARVFNKLPRLVRDLARDMSKEIDLVITGEETELDKTLIDELNDPLIHLIRNACDHGIESPQERAASGKPSRGTISLSAEHEGNHIIISIKDDGRGMDPEKLKRKAVEKGMISEADAEAMGEHEAYNLIFMPGFSTASQVTNVSGRGVGMDVVRTNITHLKGQIEVRSAVGKGTIFTLKLPLTLAIIQGLLVRAQEEVFAIPLESVLEVVRVRPDQIRTINGNEVFTLRNNVLPLARVAELFGSLPHDNAGQWMYIVVVALAHRRVGLVVDALLGQKEIVIKSLGEYLAGTRGIAGSTILGDGRAVMIIDVGQFMTMVETGAGIRRRQSEHAHLPA